jgi:hypothetical protein
MAETPSLRAFSDRVNHRVGRPYMKSRLIFRSQFRVKIFLSFS